MSTKRTATVVGAPMRHGQRREGVDAGPDSLRAEGLTKCLELAGCTVHDVGNVDMGAPMADDADHHSAHLPRSVGRACAALRRVVADACRTSDFTLVLGGDHSLAVGSITGVLDANPDTVVVWVDAHADINTPGISASGNMHGMPVAFLIGAEGTRDVPGFEWLQPVLRADRVAYIGLRDVDGPEKLVLHNHGCPSFSMHEVDEYGIAEVMRRIIARLDPEGRRNFHLSFDIDALDPVHAGSTGTLAPGGLSLREGRYICEALHATGRLRSMDLVEVNPHRFPEAAPTTIQSALLLAAHAAGEKLLHEYGRD